MKRIIKWLGDRLSGRQHFGTNGAPAHSDGGKPRELDLGVELPKELSDFVHDVSLSDISSNDDSVTVPNLKVLEPRQRDTDTSCGFDPYDTAKLYKE